MMICSAYCSRNEIQPPFPLKPPQNWHLPLPTYHHPLTTTHLLPPTYHHPLTTTHLPPPTYHHPLTTTHLPPTTHHPLPTTHLPQSTYHCILTTAYLPLPTYHCLLTTAYLPLPTYFHLLTTTYLPLLTCHCPPPRSLPPLYTPLRAVLEGYSVGDCTFWIFRYLKISVYPRKSAFCTSENFVFFSPNLS